MTLYLRFYAVFQTGEEIDPRQLLHVVDGYNIIVNRPSRIFTWNDESQAFNGRLANVQQDFEVGIWKDVFI